MIIVNFMTGKIITYKEYDSLDVLEKFNHCIMTENMRYRIIPNYLEISVTQDDKLELRRDRGNHYYMSFYSYSGTLDSLTSVFNLHEYGESYFGNFISPHLRRTPNELQLIKDNFLKEELPLLIFEINEQKFIGDLS